MDMSVHRQQKRKEKIVLFLIFLFQLTVLPEVLAYTRNGSILQVDGSRKKAGTHRHYELW